MTEPDRKHARVDGSGVEPDTLSLEAVVCRLIGGYVGVSGTVSLSIVMENEVEDEGTSVFGWMIRKVWNVGTAPPRIEIVKCNKYGGDGKPAGVVVQTLGFTPTNSAWAARWIIDYMEDKESSSFPYYTQGPWATLSVFDLPETYIILAKSTECRQRLRSMARTWELVSAATVVAST
jgi:hypothetical protein